MLFAQQRTPPRTAPLFFAQSTVIADSVTEALSSDTLTSLWTGLEAQASIALDLRKEAQDKNHRGLHAAGYMIKAGRLAALGDRNEAIGVTASALSVYRRNPDDALDCPWRAVTGRSSFLYR